MPGGSSAAQRHTEFQAWATKKVELLKAQTIDDNDMLNALYAAYQIGKSDGQEAIVNTMREAVRAFDERKGRPPQVFKATLTTTDVIHPFDSIDVCCRHPASHAIHQILPLTKKGQ